MCMMRFKKNLYNAFLCSFISFLRNVLTESARISRGNISDLTELKAADYDMVVIPGGFGAAKNL